MDGCSNINGRYFLANGNTFDLSLEVTKPFYKNQYDLTPVQCNHWERIVIRVVIGHIERCTKAMVNQQRIHHSQTRELISLIDLLTDIYDYLNMWSQQD